ncbi:MAG TPA: class I SAM-dependent methyltransferase [Solirubrobacterales bacterium]|jgi:SAM-dependent methyltransferase|nr:class I SAM-dependent methyltransferase [Solirubrobacterales bacterium]
MPSRSLTALATAVLRLPDPPERILEIGCGDGERVLFLAREFPRARVRGVEESEAAVRAAVARVGLDPEGRVAFKAGAPRSLPFPNGLFDLVVQAGGPLYPGEIARILAPAGQLLLLGRWRLLDWRLARRDLDPVETGEAAGVPFTLAALALRRS